MEKFAQFGVEPILLAAQVVNFIILIYLLKRFLYRPILEIIKKREEKIKEGLEASLRAQELLVKTQAEEKQILAKAGRQAKELLDMHKKQAGELKEELLAKAKKESDLLVAATQQSIEEERRQREKEFHSSVAKAAVVVLEGVLPKVLSKNDHIRILTASEKMLRKVLPL